jgi:hypothetical protein
VRENSDLLKLFGSKSKLGQFIRDCDESLDEDLIGFRLKPDIRTSDQ